MITGDAMIGAGVIEYVFHVTAVATDEEFLLRAREK
jgi:hypothetical protein